MAGVSETGAHCSTHRFRVMASETEVTLVEPAPAAGEWAEARLRELEARWSRFVVSSDLSIINASPDRWVPVSTDTIELIRVMQVASTLTDGGYDPTFLHQLITAGYNASIDDPDLITILVDSPSVEHDVGDVRIDVESSCVWVPHGLSLDAGGVGKGFAADLVVTELFAGGTSGALVSVGGDIAAVGTPPTPEGWHVQIEDPLRATAIIATLGVSAGGVATSSTRSRRWIHRGIEQHHVIDPETGEPSATDVASITVVANAGWLAEAHATAAMLRGAEGALVYLGERRLTGVVVDLDGTITSTADLSFERTAASPIGATG